MDLRERAEKIIKEEGYLPHPKLADAIAHALLEAQEEAFERAAKMCERKYPCGDPQHDERWCSRCSAFLDCSDLLAEEIRSLKSGVEK